MGSGIEVSPAESIAVAEDYGFQSIHYLEVDSEAHHRVGIAIENASRWAASWGMGLRRTLYPKRDIALNESLCWPDIVLDSIARFRLSLVKPVEWLIAIDGGPSIHLETWRNGGRFNENLRAVCGPNFDAIEDEPDIIYTTREDLIHDSIEVCVALADAVTLPPDTSPAGIAHWLRTRVESLELIKEKADKKQLSEDDVTNLHLIGYRIATMRRSSWIRVIVEAQEPLILASRSFSNIVAGIELDTGIHGLADSVIDAESSTWKKLTVYCSRQRLLMAEKRRNKKASEAPAEKYPPLNLNSGEWISNTKIGNQDTAESSRNQKRCASHGGKDYEDEHGPYNIDSSGRVSRKHHSGLVWYLRRTLLNPALHPKAKSGKRKTDG